MIKVAVLFGGISSEHDVSILSGKNVLNCLDRRLYEPISVFVDQKGIWHKENIAMPTKQALTGIDVVINVLHGQYGENGDVQKLLDLMSIPYTGASAQASAISLNKFRTKEILAKHDILMPNHRLIQDDSDFTKKSNNILNSKSFTGPVIVKPVRAGSSVGMTLASTLDQLNKGIKSASAYSTEVLVEEYVIGKEATVGVVDDLRGEKYYALPPIEIIPPPKSKFFDQEVKYNGKTIERVPGNFTTKETKELQRVAKLAHEKLGLRHYSRSDFIVSSKGIYFLESNSATAVGMTSESLFPKALHAIGVSATQFLDHVIRLALND